MIPQLFVESIDLGDGRNITIETGLAKQADGSVVVRIGKTVILGTVVCKKSKSSRFFTLNGRLSRKICCSRTFPGGFFKEKHQVITKY
jgi:polyribonucleotide nucleotidyltransferase